MSDIPDYVERLRRNRNGMLDRIKAMLRVGRLGQRLFTHEGALTRDAEDLFQMMAQRARLFQAGFLPDANASAYREGQRDMALFIMNLPRIDHDKIARLQAEISDNPPLNDEGRFDD